MSTIDITPEVEGEKMKYRIMTAPNVNNGSIDCMWYDVQDKGVFYGTEEPHTKAGFIPYGSFGVILPL